MSRNFNQTLIDAGSTIETAGYVNESDVANSTEFGFHVEFGANVSAGVVVIETASAKTYAGTWAILSTVSWSAASKSHYVGITDAVMVLRARVSTTIANGTVTVKVVGNNV